VDGLLADEPASAWALGTKGQILLSLAAKAGDTDAPEAHAYQRDAVEALTAAARLAPDLAWVHLSHGDALAAQHKLDAAIAATDRALLPLMRRARIEHDDGRFEDVLVTAERLGALMEDDDPLLLQLRLEALIELERFAEADAVADRSLDLPVDDAGLLSDRAF